MNMTEQWLPVPGFPKYIVSSLGRVRGSSGVIRKLYPHKDGRLSLTLYQDKHVTTYVHVLVALAFLGPKPDGLEIRHLDGDHLNNRAENLQYGTHSENMQDSVRHGTHPRASRTHCSNGHEFTPENTGRLKRQPGRRVCRKCDIDRHRKQAKA